MPRYILFNYHYQLLNLFQSGTQHLDLNFRGINYSAEVYLNGHKRVLPKGMFRTHSLDITGIVHPDGQNLLAVLVHPPDHPGSIPSAGGQGGDHEVYVYFHNNNSCFMFYSFLQNLSFLVCQKFFKILDLIQVWINGF